MTPDGEVVNGREEIRRALEPAGDGTIVSRRQPDGSWQIVLDNPLSPR
jgi:hypothetical protein